MPLQDPLNADKSQAKDEMQQSFNSAKEIQAEEARIAEETAVQKRRRAIAIVAPIIVSCIAFVIVLTTVMIPGQKLRKAIKLIDSGEYKAAYLLLDSIDYQNSKELQESIKPQYRIALLSEAEIGSTVFFGSYEQDNDTSNGKEDIEWIVLAKEGNQALVISKYALDCSQYDTSMSDTAWETCFLRQWLNGTFLKAAFSPAEQNSIASSTVTADMNPSYRTSPGNDVTDKVFLLSITEVNQYFGSDEARRCVPTEYAKAQRVFMWKTNCLWWLRSPGSLSDHAALVHGSGYVDINGRGVFNILGGVRPALWIDLGS